jgi:hypothetical protein
LNLNENELNEGAAKLSPDTLKLNRPDVEGWINPLNTAQNWPRVETVFENVASAGSYFICETITFEAP